jgi:hypothetical protein
LSPTLPDVVNGQHVECGVVLTQSSQETQDDTDIDESPFIASNEIVLNVEPIYGSVRVVDDVADTEFILDVYPQPTATCESPLMLPRGG